MFFVAVISTEDLNYALIPNGSDCDSVSVFLAYPRYNRSIKGDGF